MTTISIRKETTPNGGRYVATVEGTLGEAELTYTDRGQAVVSADHTAAPESLRGTGAALALVEHLVEDARRHGFKVIAVCPYVQAQLKRHPDWQDVMSVHK